MILAILLLLAIGFCAFALHDINTYWEAYIKDLRYKEIMRHTEYGSPSDSGKLPNVALDIITSFYGSSIIPLIANVQIIDMESFCKFYQYKYTVDWYKPNYRHSAGIRWDLK